MSDRRCVATTRGGTPCRNTATGGGPLCRRHLDAGWPLEPLVEWYSVAGEDPRPPRCPDCRDVDPRPGLRVFLSLDAAPLCRDCEEERAPFQHEVLRQWRRLIEGPVPIHVASLIAYTLGHVEAWEGWFEAGHPGPCPGEDCRWPLHEWNLPDEDEDEDENQAPAEEPEP